MRYLLDTHVLVGWFSTENHLSTKQKKILSAASPDHALVVSDISLWEVATLYSLGRVDFDYSLRDWLELATAAPLVYRVGISPVIAAEVAILPNTFHRDPADRILVATARALGLTLVSSDRRIIDSQLVEVAS